MAVLNEKEIREKLKGMNNWNFQKNELTKEYKFKDFKEALGFLNKAGDEAEKMNHHPDLFLHSWNKVKITISTHSEGGITEKDFLLAGKIENLA